jgi:hypothetical protein
MGGVAVHLFVRLFLYVYSCILVRPRDAFLLRAVAAERRGVEVQTVPYPLQFVKTLTKSAFLADVLQFQPLAKELALLERFDGLEVSGLSTHSKPIIEVTLSP